MLNRNEKYQAISDVASRYLSMEFPGFSAPSFYAGCFLQGSLPFIPIGGLPPKMDGNYLSQKGQLDKLWLNQCKPQLDQEIESLSHSVMIDPAIVYSIARKVWYERMTHFSDASFVTSMIMMQINQDDNKVVYQPDLNENDLAMGIHYVWAYLEAHRDYFQGMFFKDLTLDDIPGIVSDQINDFIEMVEQNIGIQDGPTTKRYISIAKLYLSRFLIFSLANHTSNFTLDPIDYTVAVADIFNFNEQHKANAILVLSGVEYKSDQWVKTAQTFFNNIDNNNLIIQPQGE